MARFYLPASDWLTEPALSGDEARHASQVLRAKPGEIITIFDGQGGRAAAEILSISRDRVALKLRETQPSLPPQLSITLAQAIPKGKNMDLIVQKSVELGVVAIQPLITCHTIVQPGEGKSEKWRRNALEACKQCGQDTLPKVAEPLAFDRWIRDQNELTGLKIIASLDSRALPLQKVLREHPAALQATLLIGPEGDFSAAETNSAIAAGFLPVSLGSIVLRVETATIFCLSALRYEFD